MHEEGGQCVCWSLALGVHATFSRTEHLTPHAPCRYLDWVYSRCIEYPGQPADEADSTSSVDAEGATASARGGDVAGASLAVASSGAGRSPREIALTGGVDQLLIRRLTRAVDLDQLW